jgi:hypothetical protein
MRRASAAIGVFPAVIMLSALCSSCLFQKKTVVFTPPPPRTQPKINADVARLPQPPEIKGDATATVPPVAMETPPDLPAPPDPHPAPRRAVNPAPAHNTATPPPAVAEAPAPPRLGPVFTAEQRRVYTRTLEESLDRVKHALEFLATRNLNPEQADVREKISTFQKQAEQAREQDLFLAVNLAKRADLLAQDLVARVSQ